MVVAQQGGKSRISSVTVLTFTVTVRFTTVLSNANVMKYFLDYKDVITKVVRRGQMGGVRGERGYIPSCPTFAVTFHDRNSLR